MKQIIALIALFSSISLYAQDSTSEFQLTLYPYMNSDLGTSYSLAGQYRLSSNAFINFGIKYHQNKIETIKLDNEKLHHRFYAPETINHIGLSVGIRYDIKWQHDFVQPFLYYNLAFFSMDTRTQYLPNDSSDNTGQPVPLITIGYKNLVTLENGIGVGVSSRIYKQLFLVVRGGVSGNLILNLPRSEYKNGYTINPSLQYAVGVMYGL